MFIGKGLLGVGLMAAGAWFAARALRPPEALGRAGPAPPCEVAVEIAGEGVRCFGRADAVRRRLVAGDRVDGDGSGRMRPERLAAWDAPVEINRATVDELASLDGIGPKLAARIVARRPFRTVEEVAQVRGIGWRRLARLRRRLFLDEGAGDRVR
jgi:competence ComEA-like helix-hairpin-helix protein